MTPYVPSRGGDSASEDPNLPEAKKPRLAEAPSVVSALPAMESVGGEQCSQASVPPSAVHPSCSLVSYRVRVLVHVYCAA